MRPKIHRGSKNAILSSIKLWRTKVHFIKCEFPNSFPQSWRPKKMVVSSSQSKTCDGFNFTGTGQVPSAHGASEQRNVKKLFTFFIIRLDFDLEIFELCTLNCFFINDTREVKIYLSEFIYSPPSFLRCVV